MAVVQSRSVGVQTQNRFFSSDNSTQTTCLNAMFSFAESLSDWVISEAFRYGRDMERFASYIADFIILEVFMEKSIRNLSSYLEDCMRADKPYCCLRAENVGKFAPSQALKTLNEVLERYNSSKREHHPSCIFRNFTDWESSKGSDNSGLNSALSSPDPLQALEDDIIKCLQTLTDDEDEFCSEISYPSHHLNQSSEMDSGFLSSEDNFSVDHNRKIQGRKSILPRLNENLEVGDSNFVWPEFHISSEEVLVERREQEDRARKKEDENRNGMDEVTDRQNILRTLLVQELKVNIEGRRRRNEDAPHPPVGPMFKAQATKAIWTPGRSASNAKSEDLSSLIKSENTCISQNRAQNCNNLQRTAVSKGSDGEFGSKKCNGMSNPSEFEKLEEKNVTGRPMMVNVDTANVMYSDKSIPKEAVIVDQKVTVKDGNIHQDTYYAIPYDQVTTTKTVIKAPSYEGIGPVEDGLPIGLRTAVKKEHGSDWYKTMYRSLHKCDDNEGFKVKADGYMSDPELNRKDKSSSAASRNKMSMTLKPQNKSSEFQKITYTFPSAKSSFQTYKHKPWIISDYEPGNSSLTNNENLNTNTRYLPPLLSPRPKYVYNDGYDSDSTLVRKTGKVHTLDPKQQKQWYQTIQKGGEIPLPGLCKPAPQKLQDPIVGPPPPMPPNWDADHYYKIYTPKTDTYRYTSPTHSPVQSAKMFENNKQKPQDDFFNKLDEVLLNHQEDNIRQSSVKSPSVPSPCTTPVPPNKVVILYDFVAQSLRELSLRKGDIVNIQRKIDKNWYEGKHDRKTGIFPVSYAEPISSKSTQRPPKKCINGWARAKFDFIGKNPIELTLYKDDVVALVREVDNNWYEGNLNGKYGIFPISYVEVIPELGDSVKVSQSVSQASVPLLSSPIRNGRSDIDYNRNNIENNETTNFDRLIPVSESLPTKRNLTKLNLTESAEFNNNRVSPYQALYAYKPQNDDELELKEGDVVYVVEKCDDGWFVGTSMRTGLFGTFPGNYIEKI